MLYLQRCIGILLFLLCASSFIFSSSLYAQQTVIENDKGDVFIGRVIHEDPKWITIMMEDSSEVRLNKEHITQMKFGAAARNYIGAEATDDEPVRRGKRNASMKNFSAFGVLFGSPGVLNLSYGYYFETLSFRTTLGYVGSAIGFQGNFMTNISRSENTTSDVGLGFGTMDVRLSNDLNLYWSYIGPMYNLNTYGFFLEAGLTFGSGKALVRQSDGSYARVSVMNPQLMFQIGYMYQFR